MSTADLTLYVDPACPWAWLTSRWLAEVERVRPVRVTTRLFSLAEINRGREEGATKASHDAASPALRLMAAARGAAGDRALADVYTALGEAWHERAEPLDDPATLAAAAVAAGLDAALASAALDDPATQAAVLADHAQACEQGIFGVPGLVMPGMAGIFGPVVDRRLETGEAGELWDHTLWLLRRSFFFELKRERTGRAQVARYRLAAARG